MNKQTLIVLLLSFLIIPYNIKSQTHLLETLDLKSRNNAANETRTIPADSQEVQQVTRKNHSPFTVTHFYQYTNFKKLKLISHTNINKLWEGTSTFNYPENLIASYNDNYGTEFQNSMDGITVSYHLLDGFGVSGYAGVDRFTFKSWVSPTGSQSHSTDFPAFSYGFTLDYASVIYEKIIGYGGFFYNYRSTKSLVSNNFSGEEIKSVNIKLHSWELNFLLGYSLGRLLPYVGAGYTELNAFAYQIEQIPTVNGDGVAVKNVSEFDTNFKGKAFYGIAGLEYRLNEMLAVYTRSSFPNPFRANVGLKLSF